MGTQAPPRKIPEALRAAFTMDGQIPVKENYFDERVSKPTVFDKKWFGKLLALAQKRACHGYEDADGHLYQALGKHPITGMHVAVLGSIRPWYEAVCIANGAQHVTTIEYNPIQSNVARISAITVAEFQQNPSTFDALVSISSLEHDGLGRYGDPISPDGDLRAMRECRDMLKPGGKFYLGMPFGHDYLVWNAHRVYGSIRLPRLLDGWTVLDEYGTEPPLPPAGGYRHALWVLE